MRPIFFLHLTKTGGQTLAARLASAFRPERVHMLQPPLRWPDHADRLTQLLETRDFIESHVLGPLLAKCQGIDILTTVRDPIERLISAYKHIRREPAIPLHRAALSLTPLEFFDNFGDQLADDQSRSLIHALNHFDLSLMAADGYRSWLLEQLPAALRRLRWLIPTESIDEFCPLWAGETGHLPVAREIMLNRARPDEVADWELRRIINARPELTALDSVLWTEARRWWRDWRNTRLLAGVPRRTPATEAFSDDSRGIWLTAGWLPTPQLEEGRREWWAGPGCTSTVEIRRGTARHLVVDISVIIGLGREQIAVFARPTFQRLPTRLEGEGRLRIDLTGLGEDAEITLIVPEVLSAIQVFPSDTDITRRSFAATNWRLE